MATSKIKWQNFLKYIGDTNSSGQANTATVDMTDDAKYERNGVFLIISRWSVTLVVKRQDGTEVKLIGGWSYVTAPSTSGLVATVYVGNWYATAKVFQLPNWLFS